MLPNINCLKSDKDFKKIFSGGKISENEYIKIKFLKNSNKPTRFGFIVSNKFEKRAAARNLIKRRLRAAARFLLKNIKPGFDIAVWPKAALRVDYQKITDNFKSLLIKNDIFSI